MKILTCLPVYNRKLVTGLVAENLFKYKQDSTLWVYNDWSSEYENSYLEDSCDKIFKLPKSDKVVVKNEKNKKGMGVQHLRWYQFREFLSMDYDALYLTDSDALHDPSYIDVLKNLHKKYSLANGAKMPICLYNTRWHESATIKEGKDVYMRSTAPGISQLYTKDMVSKIVTNLDKLAEDPTYAWDFRCLEYLKLPVITTKNSYVEHFGASSESMHTPRGEWDRDRALNPTEYLVNLREDTISYLEGKGSRPNI